MEGDWALGFAAWTGLLNVTVHETLLTVLPCLGADMEASCVEQRSPRNIGVITIIIIIIVQDLYETNSLQSTLQNKR